MSSRIVDVHCHLLPGIDDGSKSVDESVQILHMLKKQGVDAVVATPHYYAKHNSIDVFLEKRQKSFELLKPHLDDSCPRIILGAEVAFFFDMSKKEGIKKLCFENTNTMLLEMPIGLSWSEYELSEVQNLALDLGLDIVIAHYERYKQVQGKNEIYKTLLGLPVYIQINSEDCASLFGSKDSIDLFARGKAHLLGSDAHNTKNRAPSIDKGRRALEKKLGSDVLRGIDELSSKLVFGE